MIRTTTPRTLLAGMALLLLTWAGAQNNQTTTLDLPENAIVPEGIAYDEANGTVFVSSAADGTIVQLDPATGESTTFSEAGADGRAMALGMTVDDQGRLWVAGGRTGKVWVYDAASGRLLGTLETPEAENTLLNDVIVTAQGDAYVTDSFRPVLYRVPGGEMLGEIEPWLELGDTPIAYQEGVNLNGIVASDDGRYLLTVQMNTGDLYRIDTQSREVTRVDLGGSSLPTGDGLVLEGQTLYVVHNRHPEGTNVSVVEMTDDFASGEVTASYTDPLIASSAATGAIADGRLLITNPQFDRRDDPELPFTVTSVPLERVTGP